MPSAPLAVSSQAQKKLKTSHDHKPAADEQDKENSVGLADDEVVEGDYEDVEEGVVEAAVVEEPFPRTPAVRIPLEDLIGNTEDAFNCPPPLATPRDHVVWHNGPASSDPSVSVHGTQKSRKRARSSSPASSSQVEKSTHFDGQGDTMDLNGMQKSLRTPNNDPTQELWNRYMSANISLQANGELVLPSFARLPPSSPDTPSTTSKDGSFRRTVSCGVEWPTSKPKRRKIDAGDSHSRTKDIFAASRREILAQNVAKTSRMGLLVEKIQESMNRRQRTNDEPSSSSPLPGRNSQMPGTQPSPTRSPSKAIKPASMRPEALAPVDQSDLRSPSKKSEGSFSDFADDDLDVDFFESVEKDLSQEPAPLPDLYSIPEENLPIVVEHPTKPTPAQAQHIEKAPNSVPTAPQPQDIHPVSDKSFDDDFDDEDDTFAEELQDLADKLDSQQHLGKITTVDDPAPMDPLQEMSDDMEDVFDDDDELWAQVADETAQGKTLIGSTSQVRQCQ